MSEKTKFQMAGFWLRLGASILDSLIVSFFILLALSIVVLKYPFLIEQDSMIWVGVVIYFIAIPLLTTLYQTIFESSKFQATPGKMILKIQVIDYNGDRISFGRSLFRNISRILSALTMMIGYLMIGFSDKKQTLHDIIAKTFVIKKQSASVVSLNKQIQKNTQATMSVPEISEQETTTKPEIDKEDHRRFMPR